MSGTTFNPVQAAVDTTQAISGAQQNQATGAMQSAANTPAPQQAAPLPPVTTQPDPQATNVTNTTDQGPQFSQGKASPAEPNQPATASQGVPTGGVTKVAQSEATPTANDQGQANTGRPVVDPRPLAWLEKNDPQRFQEVQQNAKEAGINPARLAAHWYNESGFQYNPENKPGDGHGPLQVLPSTAKDFNDHGNLNVDDPHDNIKIASSLIRDLDNKYGRDSVSSVAAYQGGQGSANDIANNPDAAMRNHPQTMAYAQKMFPGYDINGGHFNSGNTVDPKAAVQAGTAGGPDGFLKYIVNASGGAPMTDAWQGAEGSLVKAFLMKGDIAGAQHARDFVLQMSHQGSNMHLMAAHQAMMNGDSVSAAQHLAAAHAFFPDGTMGQFGIDKSGNLWGARMDEHDPTKMMGQPFRVTPDGISAMLNQTQDPNQYLKMMMEERTNSANVRHLDKMGEYYGDLLKSRETIAANKNETSTTNANIRADATVTAAETRAQGRQGMGPQSALYTQANKESTALYGPDAMPSVDAQGRAALSETYVGARSMGSTAQGAEYIAGGLKDGTLRLLRGQTGEAGVADAKTGRVVGYLPQSTVDRVFGTAPAAQPQQGVPVGHPGAGTGPNTSPVGAGANSGYAQGSGVTQNLSGTVQPQQPIQQSSAVPTQPGA